MILGIGTDIVVVERVRGLWARKSTVAWERLLTPNERQFYKKRKDPVRSFAKVWACKEAIIKALGGVWSDFSWQQFEVTHTATGQPCGKLTQIVPALAQRLASRGTDIEDLVIHLSISDELSLVAAFCVAEIRISSAIR